MDYEKNGSLSLPTDSKESFSDRLEQLIGNRSIRAAAKDWGLSFSTLNNYLKKGTEPALKVAQSIAAAEGVSLEWLARGEANRHSLREPEDTYDTRNVSGNRAAWNSIYDSLSDHESEMLIKTIHRRGIYTMLSIADDDNAELLALPTQMKKLALMLKNCPAERIREISAGMEDNEYAEVPVVMLDNDQKKHA